MRKYFKITSEMKDAHICKGVARRNTMSEDKYIVTAAVSNVLREIFKEEQSKTCKKCMATVCYERCEADKCELVRRILK